MSTTAEGGNSRNLLAPGHGSDEQRARLPRCVTPAVLALTLSLAASCASSEGALEHIPRAPQYVLTVDDLVERVRRSRGELAVQTGGVLVVGVVRRLGRPCDLASGCAGVEGAYELAPVTGGRARVLVLLGDGRGVETGSTYVVSGAVEVAPTAPERWVLRGQVMAKVAP